ncbi:aspartyl aminopeptidase [Paramuricea clavata]|uniref:aspartyl aminopeptidase n=1 Tax=Paramuricea clavata TaxID=317549 RepID=A0A6S7FI42_PARCT|nr:aspartyl aminopeptidase [Paramuricea clavata]
MTILAIRQIHEEAAEPFIKFVNSSPSPFHAVEECRKLLSAQNFTELVEKSPWKIKPGGKNLRLPELPIPK